MEKIKVKNDARLWIAEGCNRYDRRMFELWLL